MKSRLSSQVFLASLFLGLSSLPNNYAFFFIFAAAAILINLENYISQKKLLFSFFIYFLISNLWILILPLKFLRFDYLFLQIVLIFIFSIATGFFFLILKSIKFQPAESFIFSIFITNYALTVSLPDYYIASSFLENNIVQKLFSNSISTIGASSVELFILLNLILFFRLLKIKKIKLAFAILLVSCLIIFTIEFIKPEHETAQKLDFKAYYPRTIADSSWDNYVNFIKKNKSADLIILPESAYNGLIEYTDEIKIINNNLLAKNSYLLLGADRRQFTGSKFEIYNSAYLFQGSSAYFQVVNKKFLAPGGEFIPWPINYYDKTLISGQKNIYSSGQSSSVKIYNYNVAVAICFEALLDSWYINSNKSDLSLIISREYLLPSFTILKADRVLALKMIQANKAYFKLGTNGYLNGSKLPSVNGEIAGQLIFYQGFSIYNYYYFMPLIWVAILILIKAMLAAGNYIFRAPNYF